MSKRGSFKFICRSIALLVAACMLTQDAALAQSAGGGALGSAKPASPYSIPSSVAWTGPLQPPTQTLSGGRDLAAPGLPDLTVVLIEDAHTNPSGQMNLASALGSVVRRHRLPVVFTEGSDRDVSLTELRRFGTPEGRVRAASPFVRRGELKGSEFLQITGGEDFSILGVEDRGLYDRAVALYAQAAGSRAKLKTVLDRVEVSMRAVGKKLLNPRLAAFTALRDAHLNEEVSSADYFARLAVLAEEAGVARARMGQLERLERVRKIERTVDYEKAGREWADAVRSLPAEERDALAAMEVGAARRNNLEAAAAAGARLRRAMGFRPVRGALGRYLQYLKAIEQLDPHALLEQAQDIESRVESGLALTADEARFVRMDRALVSLRALADLSATPESVARIEAAGKDGDLQRIAAFLNRQIMELGIAPERAILYERARAEELAAARDFYQVAFERDRVILDRMVRAARERGLKEAVLITGGFHTPHLASLIRERGMSVRVITPQVYEPTDRHRYEKLLLAQVSRDGAAAGRDSASALITPYAAETPSVLAALRIELGSLDTGGARMAGQNPDPANPARTIVAATVKADPKSAIWADEMIGFKPGQLGSKNREPREIDLTVQRLMTKIGQEPGLLDPAWEFVAAWSSATAWLDRSAPLSQSDQVYRRTADALAIELLKNAVWLSRRNLAVQAAKTAAAVFLPSPTMVGYQGPADPLFRITTEFGQAAMTSNGIGTASAQWEILGRLGWKGQTRWGSDPFILSIRHLLRTEGHQETLGWMEAGGTMPQNYAALADQTVIRMIQDWWSEKGAGTTESDARRLLSDLRVARWRVPQSLLPRIHQAADAYGADWRGTVLANEALEADPAQSTEGGAADRFERQDGADTDERGLQDETTALQRFENEGGALGPRSVDGARMAHRYTPATAEEAARLYREWIENLDVQQEQYVGVFGSGLLRADVSRPLMFLLDSRAISDKLTRMRAMQMSEAAFASLLVKDESGIFWLLKEYKVGDPQYERPFKNVPRRERLAYLLARGRANLTPVRLLTTEEIADIKAGAPAELHYLTRVVTASNLPYSELAHQNPASAFASILVANVLMRKMDPQMFNIGYSGQAPVAIDHDETFGPEYSSVPIGMARFANDYLFHALLMMIEYWLHPSARSSYDKYFLNLYSNIHEHEPDRRIHLKLTGLLQLIEKFGLGAGLVTAEKLDPERIERSILDFKRLTYEEILGMAREAGYQDEEAAEVADLVEKNRRSLGGDLGYLWDALHWTPEVPGRFRNLDPSEAAGNDVAGARMPERREHQFDGPLVSRRQFAVTLFLAGSGLAGAVVHLWRHGWTLPDRSGPPAPRPMVPMTSDVDVLSTDRAYTFDHLGHPAMLGTPGPSVNGERVFQIRSDRFRPTGIVWQFEPAVNLSNGVIRLRYGFSGGPLKARIQFKRAGETIAVFQKQITFYPTPENGHTDQRMEIGPQDLSGVNEAVIVLDEAVNANDGALDLQVMRFRVEPPVSGARMTVGPERLWRIYIPEWIPLLREGIAEQVYRRLAGIGDAMGMDEAYFEQVVREILEKGDLNLVIERSRYHVRETNGDRRRVRSAEKVKTYPKFTHWQERWHRVWTEAARTAPTAAEKLRRLSMAEFLGEIGISGPGHVRGIPSEIFVEGRLSAYREALGPDGLARLPSVEQVLIPMEGGEPIPARLILPARTRTDGPVPVIIFYHGFGMSGSSAYFDELEEKLLLEQGFAVLRPDLLSHGQSHRAMGSKAVMKQYNNAIAAFIKSRGQDLDAVRVGIYGFSFGAYLALRAALQSDLRSMVKSLVLMNPPTDETFSRSRIFQWHEGLLRELFPVEDFQRLVDKTQTLKLPLAEFLDSLSDDERRTMAAGTLVFLSTNDETIHFKDQAVIRDFAAGIGAPVVPLEGQGHFPTGLRLHGAYETAARHLGRTLAGGARMAVAAGDWKLTVVTTQSAEINGELFGAAFDLTRVELSELVSEIKEKLAGLSDLEASDLTGRAELSYLSEGMWKWAFLLRLQLRDGREVPVVIKRGKFHDSFSHDEAAVIRAAQGNGAPALILELPSSNGHFQFIEEYIDGSNADDLWGSGSPGLDVRRQLVRSVLAVTRALGGEVPRDYLNRQNYIVERTGGRALLVDLGNRRMKVLGEDADPWEQLFFIAGLADRFADNDPVLIDSAVLQALSDVWGADEARLWVSRVYAHLLILENDRSVIEKLKTVARPEEFKSEGEMLRAWEMDPEMAGRLKKALGSFLARGPAATTAGAAGIERLMDHLRRSRESGVQAHAAVLGMDDWIIRRAPDSAYDDSWKKAVEHLRAGGRVIWYSNFSKEMWFERFYLSWKERLMKEGLWDRRGLQNSFLLSAGRELLVDDPSFGGFRVILNQKSEDVADPIRWAMNRLSDIEKLKVGQGVLNLSPFLGSAQEFGRDLEIMRAFSAMTLAEKGVSGRSDGLPADPGMPIEVDEEGSVAGFVWSARHLPGVRLWDPDMIHLTPFFQTPTGIQTVEVPRDTEVYAVYQVPANSASEDLTKGRWVITEREIPSVSGARMASVPAAPLALAVSDPDLRVSGPMISLNVRDLGAVSMPLPADAAADTKPFVGVDMMKGLKTVRSWLPEFRRQGVGRVYLVGLAASGEMSGLIQSDWREPRNRRPDSLGTPGPLFYYGNPANNGAAVQVSGWLKNRKTVDGHQFDNLLGQNVFSVMDPRLIHEGSVSPAATSAESQRILTEELRALLEEARELGITVYGDWIAWRAPESVTLANYKRFFWRELSVEEESDYAKAVAEEKKLFPEGHGKRFENTRSRKKLTPTERWIAEVAKRAGPFVPVRLPLPGGGEKLVFIRRANIGIDSEDQLVPNPLHPDSIREYIEGLSWLAELGFGGARTDLGFRLLPGFIRPYYEEMRAHLSKRGQTLEGWMRASGIHTLREGESFEDWWERQKNTVQPLREIISVVRHRAREMDFVIEAYPYQSHEQKELLALGVDHNYDDSFFKGMLHALRTQSEALPNALRGALARAPHGTVYASNFDEDSLGRILKKIGRQSAVTGIHLLLAVLPRMGLPVLYTERDYLGLEGSAVPMPGGSDPTSDSHHPFPAEGEFADRLKPDWATRKIQSAPLPSMLRELEKALGPRSLPSEVWIPSNTNAKNRLVPMFWRDASGDWFLAIADLYPEWGANTGFGPGRIKIELNPAEMPAGLDPSLFTGPMAVHTPHAAWSQSPFWRIGTGDWLSKGSARTLDIDIDHDHYQSFNMVLKLGPGRAVARPNADRPVSIWESGREPRARERALLKLLTAAPAGDPDAVSAVQIALSWPDDNIRAQAANILARRSLVSRSPHVAVADYADLMMDPFAPYRTAGVQIPQAYLRVYPSEPIARQWLTRNGRYSLMHTLKHLSFLARGVSEEQAPGDIAYASEAIKRFRERLASDAASWSPSRDADLRREVDRAIEETKTVRPSVEWDRDLGTGSSVPANLAEVFRMMVLRSLAITRRYPREHRETFYWVIDAVREIVPDVVGDPVADVVYRGGGPGSGARMARHKKMPGDETKENTPTQAWADLFTETFGASPYWSGEEGGFLVPPPVEAVDRTPIRVGSFRSSEALAERLRQELLLTHGTHPQLVGAVRAIKETRFAASWLVLTQLLNLARLNPERSSEEGLFESARAELGFDAGSIERAFLDLANFHLDAGARMADFQQLERPGYWEALRLLQQMQVLSESTDYFKGVFIGDPELVRETERGLEEARRLTMDAIRESVLLARTDPAAGPRPITEALAFRVWQRRLTGNFFRRYARHLMDLAAAENDPDGSHRFNEDALRTARRSVSMLGAAYRDAVSQGLELAPKLRMEYASALEGAAIAGKRLVRNHGTKKQFTPQRWRLYTDASRDFSYAIQLIEEVRHESVHGQADKLERLTSMRNDLNRSAALSIASSEGAWRGMMHAGEREKIEPIVPQLALLVTRVGWDRSEILGTLRILAAAQIAMGDRESAIRSWTRVIQTRPDDYWSRLELIKTLIAAGDRTRAEGEMDGLRRLLPSLRRTMTAPAQARMRELEIALQSSKALIPRMPSPEAKSWDSGVKPASSPAPSKSFARVSASPALSASYEPPTPAAPKRSKTAAKSYTELRAAYDKIRGIDYSQMQRIMEAMITALRSETDYSRDRFFESEWKEWYLDEPMPDWMTRYIQACGRHRHGARMADAAGDEADALSESAGWPVLASRETVFNDRQGVMHARPSSAISRIGIHIGDWARQRGVKLDIFIRTGQGKRIHAGSVLSLMTSLIRSGDRLQVEIVGDVDPELAEDLAAAFARMINDQAYTSEPLLRSSKVDYIGIFSHILNRKKPDESVAASLLNIEVSAVEHFLERLAGEGSLGPRAHIMIERENDDVAVFRIWREGREVWYALKGQMGRMRLSETHPDLMAKLPGQTVRIHEDTDTNKRHRLAPAAAVELDLALAEELIRFAGAFTGADPGRRPVFANVELDAGDLLRRVGFAYDHSSATVMEKLRLLQAKVRNADLGRLLFPGDTDALPNAPTVRLSHPDNLSYASAASSGTLLWHYRQESDEIIPVLSSVILSALMATAPEEGRAEYLAALTPLYQRLTGSTEALTPAILEEALRDPRRLAPIKPLTLRGYLDAAVYLQELSRKAAATAA